jgi:hypothetical protein
MQNKISRSETEEYYNSNKKLQRMEDFTFLFFTLFLRRLKNAP